MPKKVLILDVDGVIYNWDGMARDILFKQFGIHVPPSTHWEFIPEFIGEEKWTWLWEEGVKKGLFRYGHPYHEELQQVNTLSKYFDILLVTKTPEVCRHDRIWWLAQWGLNIKGLIMLNKEESKGLVGGDIIVDDNPSYVTEWKALNPNGTGIIFTRSWNAGFDAYLYGLHRIEHLADLLDTGENYGTLQTTAEGFLAFPEGEGVALAT